MIVGSNDYSQQCRFAFMAMHSLLTTILSSFISKGGELRCLFAFSTAPQRNGKEGFNMRREMFEILAGTIISGSFQHKWIRVRFVCFAEIAREHDLHSWRQPCNCLWW